jgi:hypothetical protein
LLFFVLSFALSSFPVNACAWDSIYQKCTGSCLCGNCGPNACQLIAPSTCGCITNTPQPQPTNTPPGGIASPTDTPVPTPKECKTTQDCEPLCTGIPNCSATCQNGYCYTTNPTAQPTNRCNTWGNWSACMSGQDTCSACAAQGYTCQTRFCANPSNSYLYQISCGCSQQPGGGSANPTNTPAPTASPIPTGSN